MVSTSVSLFTMLRARLSPSHSSAAGVNSMKSTVRYRATQAATSKSSEVVPDWTMKGYGSRQGRPTS